MDEKLKPCPFCGYRKVWLVYSRTTKKMHVYCAGCTAKGPGEKAKKKANAAWNKRVMEGTHE